MNIDKLILKLFNKKHSLEELEILESWKKESEDNIAFLNLMSITPDNQDYHQFDTDKAWSKIESQTSGSASSKPFIKWAVAAVLVTVLAYAGFTVGQKSADALQTFKSADSVAEHVLKDNSKIWLNSGSQLAEVTDFDQSRHVNLRGEAFFEVEANPANPFIIDVTNDAFIRVVGTSFNVISEAEVFDLCVYSGKVEFHALNRVIVLERGDRLQWIDGAYVKTKNKDKNLTSWKSKRLVFENDPLAEALVAISDYYNVSIEIDGSLNLLDCRLRSRFEDESFDEVLKELNTLFNLSYDKRENGIYINGITCI